MNQIYCKIKPFSCVLFSEKLERELIMKYLQNIFLAILLIGLPLVSVSQEKPGKPPSRKEQEKKAAKQEKASIKAQKKAKKDYYNMQSSETKRSMKKNKKSSTRNRNRKKEPFWKRWFRR